MGSIEGQNDRVARNHEAKMAGGNAANAGVSVESDMQAAIEAAWFQARSPNGRTAASTPPLAQARVMRLEDDVADAWFR